MIGKTNAISGVSAPVPIIKTVSGSVISISDALAQDAESLVVGIEPIQSGSGDPSPSNVRPISGWSAVKVARCGKNLFDKTVFADYSNWEYPIATSGFQADSSNRGCFLPDLGAGTFTISFDWTIEFPTYLYLCKVDSTGFGTRVAYLTTTNISNKKYTFTLSSGERAFLRMGTENEAYFNTQFAKFGNCQLELGSIATAYEPYNGNTYNIQLGQTVYGGSLDVTTGVLTVDMATIDLGSLSWTYYTSQQIPMFYADISGGKVYPTGTSVKAYCSDYKVEPRSMSASNFAGLGYFHAAFNGASTSRVLISDSRYTDRDTFKTAMSGSKLVYELATPQTVQLTPTEVQMLLGNNVLWADSGDSELQYWARR